MLIYGARIIDIKLKTVKQIPFRVDDFFAAVAQYWK